MKRLVIVAINLCAALAGPIGVVPVQAQGPVIYDDASGASGTCNVSGPPGDQMVVCSDLRPGNGMTITAPAKTSSGGNGESAAPAPEPDAAPAPDAAAPEASDRAVPTANDQDADNAPDDTEPSLGLDPTNPDTDADGVADGDEINIYGTDPLAFDTDGDGVGDGEELFGIYTDPLVANDAGTQDTAAAE